MCDWERAQIPTQTSCYEGVFFFDNSNCVHYVRFNFHFSSSSFFAFSSQQPTFLSIFFSSSARRFFFSLREAKKSANTLARGKKKKKIRKEKWWKTCDSLVCEWVREWERERNRTYIFHKAHSSFENLGRKEVWQLLWGGRSLKCWLSAFRFSFKYIGLFFMKMIFLYRTQGCFNSKRLKCIKFAITVNFIFLDENIIKCVYILIIIIIIRIYV